MPARRLLSYGLVLLLTVELAVWGAFLVPLRVGRVPVPVGLAVALAVAPLCRAGGRVLGRRAGAVGVMVLWTGVALVLSQRRTEGDLVITNSLRGLAYLAVGLLTAALVVGAWRPAPAPAVPGRDPGGGAE